jgi:catechol 2,3-dioxygenase-like lactoylglutathione lyase family enzyme
MSAERASRRRSSWWPTAALCCLTPTFAAQPSPGITEIDSVAMTVSNMDRAVEFYSHVLTFEKVSEHEVSGDAYEHLWGLFGVRVHEVRMRLGEEQIELLQFLAPSGRPIPIDSRSNDHWFQHVAVIVSDMRAAYTRLLSFNVAHASSGPQRLPEWNPNAGGIEAFYFRDPDGHNLEILAFPPGKGLQKWHAHDDGRLFLGIDHTAIVVNDTERSLRFYRDLLGMRLVGSSENYGTEQEHLNKVFGAHLRITALRAAKGPGVEFLEYVTPPGGRAAPLDTEPADLWYWQINMCTRGSAAMEASLRAAHAPLVSTRVDLPDLTLGWQSGLIARDPDGHASLIGEATRCTKT